MQVVDDRSVTPHRVFALGLWHHNKYKYNTENLLQGLLQAGMKCFLPVDLIKDSGLCIFAHTCTGSEYMQDKCKASESDSLM